MSSPWNSTRPLVGTSRRLHSRSSVVLPAPDGPASTVMPDVGTEADTWSRIVAPSGVVSDTSSNRKASAGVSSTRPSIARMTVRARMPSVARNALSGIIGKMFAAFQSSPISDQS